jgi:hypothetical protein
MIVNLVGSTGGSLPVTTCPHLADHTQTQNVRDANKNGHKITDRNLRKHAARFCKTLIQFRFDLNGGVHPTPVRQTYAQLQQW